MAATETIKHANIVSFTCLKAIAYNDRQERKDAHDLVYCLEHVPHNLTEVATMFRDNMDGNHRDVLRHSLELLRSRFATVGNVEGYLKDGPVAVAKFELGEDDEARALRQRQASDVIANATSTVFIHMPNLGIVYNIDMTKKTKRVYRSSARQRQAEDTRTRIGDAAHQLLIEKRYEGMTIDAIAQRAEVSPQTVYAVFRSKAGILAELLDRTSFGPGYQDLTRQASECDYPPDRLKFAARIARHVHESQLETMDLLRGVSLVTPELAKIMHDRECHRYDSQRQLIEFVRQKGWLNLGIDTTQARDILWSFTSREMYSMLVHQRKWSPDQYEKWLGDILVSHLLKLPKSATLDASQPKGRSKRPAI